MLRVNRSHGQMLKISRESPWDESHRKWSAQSKVAECATSSVGQRNHTKISPHLSSSPLSTASSSSAAISCFLHDCDVQ